MPANSNIFSLNGAPLSTNNLIGDLRVLFEHSYFNVLLNNVYGARKSSHYFDVDYNNTTQFLPVNFNYIISQSAAVASVQDSNYTTKRVISSRYEGSKTISSGYQLEGTASYGPQYTIDWTTPYFAVFEEVTEAFPKGGGGSKVNISKLVYKDGTVIPLDDRGENYFDVTTIFTPDDNVSLYYTDIPSGTFIANNLTTKTVDESGHLYTTIASYRPTTTLPSGFSSTTLPPTLNPLVNQDDNVVYYSFLDISASYDIYREQVAYGYNNLLAQKSGENAFYMYFNFPNSASAGYDPFNSIGYFLGMGLILRNFYPNTGEQYPSYRTYPWVRFEHFNTSSVAGQNYPPYVDNYNFYVNTELLPVKEGDYIRVYNATEAPIDAYSDDANLFFLSNASGSFIKDSIYDSIIDKVDYTLATSLNFLTLSGSANLSSENFLISNTSASIYRTSNRFGDISPAVRNDPTDVFVCEVINGNGLEIGPKNVNNNPTLGDNTIFKKLYTFNNFTYGQTGTSSFANTIFYPTTKYKHWALGNSGSLYRAEGLLGGTYPFRFSKVTNNDIALYNGNPLGSFDINSISCSFTAMASLNDSPLYYNPNLSSGGPGFPAGAFLKSYYNWGLYVVVGDSGSVFISRNYGNTWNDISLDYTRFPNKDDIHFKDVFVGTFKPSSPANARLTQYIMAVGTSGSIYITTGSIETNITPGGGVNTSQYPFDFKNNWSSYYSYQYFVDIEDFEISSQAYLFPAGALRENFTFNKIIPVQNLVNDPIMVTTSDTATGFVILANSGSLFFINGYFQGVNTTWGLIGYDDFYIKNYKTSNIPYTSNNSSFEGKLIAITGSYINSLIRGGYVYPPTTEFIDGIVSQSNDRFDINAWYPGSNQNQIITGSIKLLLLDKNGTVWKEPHFVSSSLIGADTNSFEPGTPQAFKIFEQLNSASLNEIREFSSINYANSVLNNEPFIWIPSSQKTLLHYPSSLVWSSSTIISTFNDLDLNSGSFFTGSNSAYPTTSFYSITSVENMNTAYSPVWVRFTPRAPFPYGFAEGRSSFPYATNPSYGPNSPIGLTDYTGTRQAFRFYRKYSNEQYVLTKEYTQNGKGFIVPGNYDPSLNYIEIAKKAGLIT